MHQTTWPENDIEHVCRWVHSTIWNSGTKDQLQWCSLGRCIFLRSLYCYSWQDPCTTNTHSRPQSLEGGSMSNWSQSPSSFGDEVLHSVPELQSLLPLDPCSFPRPLLHIRYFSILHSNFDPWFCSWNSICLTLPDPPRSMPTFRLP